MRGFLGAHEACEMNLQLHIPAEVECGSTRCIRPVWQTFWSKTLGDTGPSPNSIVTVDQHINPRLQASPVVSPI